MEYPSGREHYAYDERGREIERVVELWNPLTSTFAQHGADTLSAGAAALWTGEATRTVTAQAGSAAALAAGASPEAASLVGFGADLVLGVGSSLTAAIARNTTRLIETAAPAITARLPGGVCFAAGTPIATAAGPVPIQELRVGDRVLTHGEVQSSATGVDPASWRLVRLEMPNPDGSADVLEIEALRSLAWLGEHGAFVGARVDFVLEEMGLEGPAVVMGIEACPEIGAGAGRVVLATISHLNGEILEIKFEGNDTVLEPTARHRLFSADRNAWIAAGRLEVGEALRTSQGTAQIASIRAKPGVHRVYNLEVETEHSFLASALAILSHNENPCAAVAGGPVSGYQPHLRS